ncbi:LAME_0E13652g1_1 [Lachancea meyersii CBS 8951]|uniref:Histone-lysine N-methyltransferase SET5 n=1 Tax=Lachancea meyersii CBS 8951 TaxID=1266667 RepID=A0A1G4JM87_9SACH|nr:LAME_0E13652g1_1 [Lachancea meyersii CBS 8951]
MPLRLEQMHLNDETHEEELSKEPKIEPSDKEICDDVVLLWRQEPAFEDVETAILLEKIATRNPRWDLSLERLKKTLVEHNLSFSDESQLFTYADQVESSQCPHIDPKVLEKIELRQTGPHSSSAFALKDLRQDEVIFYEHEPLTPILPLDKTSLAQNGRSCALCGHSLTQSSQFTVKNMLDCQQCSAVWCSKHCKRLDAASHGFLKHPLSKNKKVSAVGWLEFEDLCKENAMHAAYSVGIIYARILLDKQEGSRIREQFDSLAQVSQNLRAKAADSTNVGGTFDRTTGAVPVEEQSLWKRIFDSFCKAFPQIVEEEGLDFETYLTYIGKFNINQLEGQIFTIYSHLNHECEPNVRYELNAKSGLKVYARKNIKKGDQLFTTYVNPLHGVTLRRRELLVNWGFLCNCPRCQKELDARQKAGRISTSLLKAPLATTSRRKSSMKATKPDLSELLKNGQEFDLEIPVEFGFDRRRKSVRFDERVMAAVEE